MALGQIIRRRRIELNLTLDEVAAKIGFSKPYVSTVETGKVKNPPSDNFLKRLEEVLQFEKGLLQHIAHLERLPADIRRDYEAIDAENRKFRQLIKNIVEKKTDPGSIGGVVSLEELGLDIEEGAKRPVTAGQLVPVINKVAAGYPVDFDDLGYPAGFADDYVRCPDLHDPNAFAVRVVGDSMEPKFNEGDIVVFSPAADVHSGDDCFVRFTMPHETTFKRVYFEDSGLRLQPRNQNYAPRFVEGDRVNGIYRAVIRYEKL
ncbi:LexA repressor [Anaerohalosphaera lusitana]|uniref:LexA repressor n=1 Tax=Anaerohalosphaera lusitana TaxID=1936003 RepID=A0A1U9NQR6_9BACT|nr:S24 family peptidase [Anaerohalosphaera lusitana]AQT70273.1 LexA repressor [Anaerohalosphaera lusitana]